MGLVQQKYRASVTVVAIAVLAGVHLSTRARTVPPDADQDLEPAVTVKQYPNRTEEEYRVNGNLYAIRIQPEKAPPYYLVDREGTGNFDLRQSEVGAPIQPPQWTLFRW